MKKHYVFPRYVRNLRPKKAVGLALSAFLGMLVIPPAYAGFEWSPPSSQPQQMQMPSPQQSPQEDRSGGYIPAPDKPKAAPPIEVEAIPVEPQRQTRAAAAAEKPETADKKAPSADDFISSVMRELDRQKEQPRAGAAGMPESTYDSYETAEGFGSDIALALALRQVVPPRYGFSFEEGINKGQRISWSGGKPWPQVLNEALAPQGLRAVVKDDVVRIETGAASPASASVERATAQEKESAHSAPQNTQLATKMKRYGGAQETLTPMPGEKSAGAESIQTDPFDHLLKSAPEPGRYTKKPRQPVRQATPETVAPGAKAVPLDDGRGASGGPTRLSSTSAGIKTTRSFAGGGGQHTAPEMPKTMDIHYWQAEAGQDLETVLQEWAQKTGARLVWNTSFDYRVLRSFTMHGQFPSAVEELLSNYEGEARRPVGELYPNLPDGPPVLVIKTRSGGV